MIYRERERLRDCVREKERHRERERERERKKKRKRKMIERYREREREEKQGQTSNSRVKDCKKTKSSLICVSGEILFANDKGSWAPPFGQSSKNKTISSMPNPRKANH